MKPIKIKDKNRPIKILTLLFHITACGFPMRGFATEIKQIATENSTRIPAGNSHSSVFEFTAFRLHAEVNKAGTDDSVSKSDARLKNCLALESGYISWSDEDYRAVNIGNFGEITSQQRYNSPEVMQSARLEGKIINNCNTDEDVTLKVWADSTDSSSGPGTTIVWRADKMHIVAQKKCWMYIPETVNFGNVPAGGTSEQKLVIIDNELVNDGYVQITSSDLVAPGTLYLGGSQELKVTTDTPHFLGNHWNNISPNIRQDEIPLTLKASKNAKPGKYASILTATLTCP